jgi:hypothetical protein
MELTALLRPFVDHVAGAADGAAEAPLSARRTATP